MLLAARLLVLIPALQPEAQPDQATAQTPLKAGSPGLTLWYKLLSLVFMICMSWAHLPWLFYLHHLPPSALLKYATLQPQWGIHNP